MYISYQCDQVFDCSSFPRALFFYTKPDSKVLYCYNAIYPLTNRFRRRAISSVFAHRVETNFFWIVGIRPPFLQAPDAICCEWQSFFHRVQFVFYSFGSQIRVKLTASKQSLHLWRLSKNCCSDHESRV